MTRALHRTTASHPFYRFVRSLSLKASCPHPEYVPVYYGTFTKTDDEASQTLTLVSFQRKAYPSGPGGCRASLSVNEKPFHGLPFTTINITPLGNRGINHFTVWSQAIPRQFAVSVGQVEKVPEEEVLRSLDDDYVPYVHKRVDTKRLVRSNFDESSGDPVVETLQVSLVCPLSRTKMKVPCRGARCGHVQCFDAYAYLSVNEGTLKPSWCCPVCDLELPVEDMRVDLFTLHILGEAEEHCVGVRLFADGQWEKVAAGKDDDENSIIVIEDSL